MKKIDAASQVSDWIARIISEIPEPRLEGKPSEEIYVRKIIKNSALKSSSVSAALAIPGGVMGFVSVLPDIATVWRIQSQMISDIAAAHGKSSLVTREQMLWCMFRQVAVGLMKEYIVQEGTKFVVKKGSEQALKGILGKVAHGVVKTQGAKSLSKVVPVLGSVSAGALTYYDTWRVGKNAHELYSRQIILLPESAGEVSPPPP